LAQLTAAASGQGTNGTDRCFCKRDNRRNAVFAEMQRIEAAARVAMGNFEGASDVQPTARRWGTYTLLVFAVSIAVLAIPS
jgi:hypothetical protein